MAATTEGLQQSAAPLGPLVGRLFEAEDFGAVLASLQAGHSATLDGVRGSSCALAAAALAERCAATLVIVCPHQAEIDEMVDDLLLFSPRESARFPAYDTLPSEQSVRDEVFGDRLRVLKQLRDERPGQVLVTSIQSLLQPVPSPERLAGQARRLAVGQTLDVEELVRWLVEQGFQGMAAVELPGEFSRRGGIIDIFAADWYDPIRIELFGDTIESIREFQVSSQRSLATMETVELTALGPSTGDSAALADHLPRNSWFLMIEPNQLEDEGRHYLNRLDHPRGFFSVSAALEAAYRFPSVTAASLSVSSMETTYRMKVESVERFSGDIAKVRSELDAAGLGQDVYIVCQTEAESQRLSELFADTQLAKQGKLHFPQGHLRAGFRLVNDRVVLISGGELFHRVDVARPSRRRLTRIIDSFLDLREGDYVVHVAHGIGKYRGLRQLEAHGQTEEHLEIEFDGQTRMYVPASKIELVQKYVGGSKARPTLAKIGGRSWSRQKADAEQAVADLAADMLELQAARASRPGIAFPTDSLWQQEFDASFPYQETPDQLAGIAAIRQDMTAARPMDRLVCGDVGYGKTELAMRAAFKAVDAGYQVAVLVPTTVLAAQHGRTFLARMSEFPCRIAVLSRFCSAKEERDILKGMAEGKIDIVIGTHRLASHDIQFKNLGLLVIDEEQRFGVGVKERLKAYRHIVDVLTLTATPIPRTLHMSLLGLRDISNLETPPADRLAVETRVTRFDDDLIRQAILRELNRNGQVFFVHNRIHDIEKLQWRLQQIVPEASFGIGHGQMGEDALEEVMLDFVAHKFDVLLSTTIIESGLDIPNANTIFIDDAESYGLADMHQLRGRVGRYKHRAYCYLLLDPRKSLTPTAAKRLTAIEEFSAMGAGFAIAMRDLEIRGAGNILGTQQSGHIAAVGYEMYCDLLDKTVRRLKKLPPKPNLEVTLTLPGEALLPRRYVPDMRLKIDLYRRLARVSTLAELSDLRNEMVDRFGPMPEEVDRLLRRTEIGVLAKNWLIDSIHLEENHIVFGYSSRPRIDQLVRRQPKRLRVVDTRTAYGTISSSKPDPDALLSLIKTLLQSD
ncbi:MAG: transcription-repair coupling factor [Planctomycetes bacterium]|nr:transcription-repair coupling factor [Planctomycetota bacterium]